MVAILPPYFAQLLCPNSWVHYNFPGYTPELNPAEFVWTQADAALANSGPDDLKELRTRLNKSKRRLHNSQRLLWSCIWASDLPWTR